MSCGLRAKPLIKGALIVVLVLLLGLAAAGRLAMPQWGVAGLCLAILAVLGWIFCSAASARAVHGLALVVLDAEPGPRMIVGPSGKTLYANSAARALWGDDGPVASLLARTGALPRAKEAVERLGEAARKGVPDCADVPQVLDLGASEWLSVSVRPLGTAGGEMLWSAEDISARRAIEDVLQQDQEDFSDFFDFLPVGLFSTDSEGTLRIVNQRLAEWLGQTVDDLTGKPISHLLAQPLSPEVDEEERGEARFQTADGGTFDAYISYAPYDDAGETCTRWVVVRDVMPEQEWEQALNESEQRFRWLFDDSPVGVALVDLEGAVTDCNHAFAAMLGKKRGVMINQALVDFIAREDQSEVKSVLSKVVMGAVGGAQTDVRMEAEKETITSLFVSPVGEGEDVSGLVLHFIDTTERKTLEAQFAQAQKMQAMGQMAGGVAHDFNNLLTAMIGFCDLLLQRHTPGDPSFPDLMQIKQNANRAANLVRQLLAFSRRQPLKPQALDVTEAMAELSHLLRRLLGEAVTLNMVHGRNVGLVRVDPGQFDQVIINLAVNARDAMVGGGALTITSGIKEIDQPTERGAEIVPPGTYVEVTVKDTGEGIPKENLSRLFEPFFSTKEAGHGTGLGLATVYGIVRQTEGFIFVDSAPREGAVFTILLPRYESADDVDSVLDATSEAAQAVEQLALDLKEETALRATPDDLPAPDLGGEGLILLVEDEDAVRVFATRALRNKGYTVLEANNGETALGVLDEAGPIDLLITDMMMPGMDGAELARRVQSQRPSVRLLLISGYSEDVAQGSFDDFPNVHFLAKPFSLNELASKVKHVLEG